MRCRRGPLVSAGMSRRGGPTWRWWCEMFSRRWPYTPRTPRGLVGLDHLPPEEALVRAWSEPGAASRWHWMCVQVVRDCMPLLARALDRLVEARSEK